jgi:ADP-ribose pyrophosphatase YjhB (NUDIX family)
VVCASCGYAVYVNPKPSGTAIIVEGDRFLVIRRARQPRAGWWDLPGGFCDAFEHPADAAVREAREELGVDILLGDFVGMWIGAYDFQDESLPVLDCFWLARIVAGEITVDPAEGSEYAWMSIANPPPLAFATMDSAMGEVKIRRSASRLVL